MAAKKPKTKLKKATGRPSVYTPDLGGKILKFISAGSYMEPAAAVVGIAKSTLYDWLKRGARDRRKGEATDLAQFSELMEIADAKAETRSVVLVANAAKAHWQAAAWWLERKHPDRWGRKKLEISADTGAADGKGLVIFIPNEKPE